MISNKRGQEDACCRGSGRARVCWSGHHVISSSRCDGTADRPWSPYNNINIIVNGSLTIASLVTRSSKKRMRRRNIIKIRIDVIIRYQLNWKDNDNSWGRTWWMLLDIYMNSNITSYYCSTLWPYPFPSYGERGSNSLAIDTARFNCSLKLMSYLNQQQNKINWQQL